MPIYAYKCESCGHRKDVLQKLSDPLLTVCPACGAASFVKQVTAAGFQLKGSGWYVTDFRDGGGKKPTEGEKAADGADKPAATEAAASAPASPAAPAPAAAPSPAPAPAAAASPSPSSSSSA